MTSIELDPLAAALTPDRSLADLRFAVIDVETSGLDVHRHRVLQVAAVVVDGHGQVFDTFESTIRPTYGVLSRVGPRHIHGISRWSLRRAPSVAEVLAELAPRLLGAVVTGHNVAFDVAFLRRMAALAGSSLDLTPTLCTLELSRLLDPEHKQRHRLVDLSDRYGVGHERPHDALADAQATAAILPTLLRSSGVTDANRLRRVLRPRPVQM